MYCSKCGTEIKEGAKFCSKCGAPLGERRMESFAQAVQMALSGSEAGFTYLYEETYKSKFYLAIKYMENREAAEDVLQDAYIKAFEKLDTLKDPETFPAWLGTIVANTAKNALQKNNPVLFSDLSDETEEGEELALQIEDESVDVQPEASYLQQETTELLAEMMSSLSEEQRMCILMYHVEGDSIREIAEALDCSENTVKSRLNYGRKNLRVKAEELKKKGYAIAGSASIPLLLTLLSNDAYAMSAEPAFLAAGKQMEAYILRQIPSLLQGAVQAGAGAAEAGTQTAAGTGAKTAAGAAGQGFLATTAGKVVLTVIIAAVVAGGVGGGLAVRHNNQVKEEAAKETEEPTVDDSTAEAEDKAAKETKDGAEDEVEEKTEETQTEESEEVVEEEGEEEGVSVTDDMYPELLEGGLTREQFEIALAYAPEEMEYNAISVDDLLSIVSEICYDFGDICFHGTLSDSMYEPRHYNCSLADVNRFLSVLSDDALSESDTRPDDVEISGDAVSVSIYDGEWMTPSAKITNAVLEEDTLTVTYDVRATGSGGYYPESTATRTAILKPTGSDTYRLERIFLGTVEEPYASERQELLVTEDNGYQLEDIYYDLITMDKNDDAHRAINDGLYEDYQSYRAYSERISGKTMDELIAMGTDSGIYRLDAGVTNIDNGILSVRCEYTTMGEVNQTLQYGLTYSLETGEQLRITDLTDLSDDDLLTAIKAVLFAYVEGNSFQDIVDLISKINAYTLDDIGSGIDCLDTSKISFYVDAGEIVILIPPGEFFRDIWTNYAIPTGIYIPGAHAEADETTPSYEEEGGDASGNIAVASAAPANACLTEPYFDEQQAGLFY